MREAGPHAVRAIAAEPWKPLGDAVAHAVRLVGGSDAVGVTQV
ncbi:hypothetical protein [Streptomyces sp. NPDC014623]